MKNISINIGALVLATFSMCCYAQQTVPIVWPFGAASTPASTARAIIEEANKQQSKYVFHFETKPGAGGSLAANYITNYNGIALMTSSSSFFVRPTYYPNESYRLTDFTPVLIQCVNQPYVLVSAKYKSFNDLKYQKKLNLGVNFGSLTEAIGRELKTTAPGVDFEFIGYSDAVKPTLDVIGGSLDMSIGLPGAHAAWIESGKVNVVGMTGTKDFSNYKTFSSQGVRGFEDLVSSYQIVIKRGTDSVIVQELHDILRKASKDSARLDTLYKNDFCTQVDVDLKTTNTMYDRFSKNWANMLKKIN